MNNCNCKKINNFNEFGSAISETMERKKLSVWEKTKVCWTFFLFYFLFTTSSIKNFMLNDKLEPKIPSWFYKKIKQH